MQELCPAIRTPEAIEIGLHMAIAYPDVRVEHVPTWHLGSAELNMIKIHATCGNILQIQTARIVCGGFYASIAYTDPRGQFVRGTFGPQNDVLYVPTLQYLTFEIKAFFNEMNSPGVLPNVSTQLLRCSKKSIRSNNKRSASR